MITPKLAVVYNSSLVRPHEVASAIAGLKRFERFDVSVESIDTKVSSPSLRRLKRGGVLKEANKSSKFYLHEFDLQHASFLETFLWFYPKDILGIGLVPGQIYKLNGAGIHDEPHLGSSMLNMGGLVSLEHIRQNHLSISEKAIEIVTVHEAGHVLGIPEHCSNRTRIMQENKDYVDFVNRFLEEANDFCRSCTNKLERYINGLAISQVI